VFAGKERCHKKSEMINCRDTYIVRVYRYTPDNPSAVVGVVETIGNQGRQAFTNLDELWEILNEKKGKTAKKEGEGIGTGGRKEGEEFKIEMGKRRK
jgi:uncharacterized protein affecting Mg2+/Co2+ transport